jgi:16S rRNA G966 N2-methylase RsmD
MPITTLDMGRTTPPLGSCFMRRAPVNAIKYVYDFAFNNEACQSIGRKMVISNDLDFFKSRYTHFKENWYCHYVGIPGMAGFSRYNYHNYFTSMWNSQQISEWLFVIGSRITPFWITRGVNYLQLGAVVEYKEKIMWRPFTKIGKLPMWAFKYSIIDWDATVQKYTRVGKQKYSYRIFTNRSYSTRPKVLSRVVSELARDKVGVVVDPFSGSGHDSCYLATVMGADKVYLYDSDIVASQLSAFNSKQFGLKSVVTVSRFKNFHKIFKNILKRENKRKLFYFDPPWTSYVSTQKDYIFGTTSLLSVIRMIQEFKHIRILVKMSVNHQLGIFNTVLIDGLRWYYFSPDQSLCIER